MVSKAQKHEKHVSGLFVCKVCGKKFRKKAFSKFLADIRMCPPCYTDASVGDVVESLKENQ